jgi:hypothetical protein
VDKFSSNISTHTYNIEVFSSSSTQNKSKSSQSSTRSQNIAKDVASAQSFASFSSLNCRPAHDVAHMVSTIVALLFC